MKLTFALISLCLASLSYAETCYQSEVQLPTYLKLPEVICISSTDLVVMKPRLPGTPHYEAFVETSLGRLTNLNVTFSGEAPFKVAVEGLVREEGSSQGCGDLNTSTLVVDLSVDASGLKLTSAPQVSVRQESTHDVCHSQTEVTVFKYHQI
jgi:hypothetical protein